MAFCMQDPPRPVKQEWHEGIGRSYGTCIRTWTVKQAHPSLDRIGAFANDTCWLKQGASAPTLWRCPCIEATAQKAFFAVHHLPHSAGVGEELHRERLESPDPTQRALALLKGVSATLKRRIPGLSCYKTNSTSYIINIIKASTSCLEEL